MSQEHPPMTINYASDNPAQSAMFSVGFLYRLGGQETFTLEELTHINLEYDGLTIFFDKSKEPPLLVLKLHAREGQS